MSTNLVATALAKQEEIIARGLASFIEVGDALLVIRSERLYLQSHDTFEAYCQERWGFTSRRAGQMIGASSVVGTIVPTGLPAPTNEGQARELAKVPEPKRKEVWRETLKQTNGKPTAAAVRKVVAPAAEPESTPDPEPTVPKGTVDPEPTPAPRPATPRPVRGPTARNEEQRDREVIETGRRAAAHIVANWQTDVVSIHSAIELGETDLITEQMITELRRCIELLERHL